MTENMKNIIVFIEPNEHSFSPNWKIAHLYLNRFTIDEDASFELLGVYYLKKCHKDLVNQPEEFRVQRKEKVTVMNSNTVKKKGLTVTIPLGFPQPKSIFRVLNGLESQNSS